MSHRNLRILAAGLLAITLSLCVLLAIFAPKKAEAPKTPGTSTSPPSPTPATPTSVPSEVTVTPGKVDDIKPRRKFRLRKR